MKKTLWIAILCALFLSSKAHAHALWIERGPDGAPSVCYGEYGEGLREKSEGKLDDIAHLEVWSVSSEGVKTVIHPEKTAERFALKGGSGVVLVQDVSLPVKDMSNMKGTGAGKSPVARRFLYARYGGAGEKPELRLDALELSGPEPKARVFFDGAPLAGEKAVLTAPNGWTKEFKTDTEGVVELPLPWAGLYILEVTHTVEKPGEYLEKSYQIERHRTSLSIEKK